MIVYRELSSLERDLGIPAKTLYAVSNSLSRHYQTAKIPKKGGGYRTLSVPDPVLKQIQRQIAAVLLAHMNVSAYANAYRFDRSTLTNAAAHVGKPLILKLDILRFFDSIRYSAVKDAAFPPEIYGENLRVLLTMLCYYRDSLPQGAPTSPAITNLLLYDFDETVGSWCRGRSISYTRYCDDMTFSGDFRPKEVIGFVRTELGKLGFLLNAQKTRLQRAAQRQTVTGIVVNERPHVPVESRRKLRQDLYYCQKYGPAEHLRRTGLEIAEDRYLMQLLGRVSYVLQISPEDAAMRQAKFWLQAAVKRCANRAGDL